MAGQVTMAWFGNLWRRLFPPPVPRSAPVPVAPSPPPAARPAVEILEVREKKPEPDLPAVGSCQVCGTEMKTDVVTCRKCRTPHHRSCWNYMGKCTTYGCKEKNATQIRDRGAGEDEIVFIDERPQQDKNSVRVWMDQIADRYRGSPVQRETPKRGRYNLRFERAGIRCSLEGRRGSHAWRIRFRAKLTPEQMARVPADTRVTREENEHGVLTLRSVDDLNRFEQLEGFFDACLRMVDAAVTPRSSP